MLKDLQDAFGHSMYDYLNGIKGAEVTERDDGSIAPGGGPAAYFAQYRKWHPLERKAMRYVRGRVLDVGCRAGRHSLYLQEKGHDVVGIDNSPLAIEVCKKRGLKHARLISLSRVGPTQGQTLSKHSVSSCELRCHPEFLHEIRCEGESVSFD